jgi:hypothetical protein
MDSFILEDINELLKLKKGDSSRLIRIKEACESKEIVSLYDRKYVERLSSQYLREPEQKKPKNQDKPKFVPIEEDVPFKKKEDLVINQTPQIEKPKLSKEQLIFENSEGNIASKILNLNLNKKMIFAIGSIALAIILIGVVAIGIEGVQFLGNSEIIKSDSLSDFSLKTDRTSYETSDIISISGKMSSSSQGTVKLSIENENTELVWAENLNLKNNGEFSTLLIAGGQGWDNSGKYFLNVEYNEFSNKISFDFIAR